MKSNDRGGYLAWRGCRTDDAARQRHDQDEAVDLSAHEYSTMSHTEGAGRYHLPNMALPHEGRAGVVQVTVLIEGRRAAVGAGRLPLRLLVDGYNCN